MSVILVVPFDGQQIDHLREAVRSWREYGPEIDHIILVGDVRGLVAGPDTPATLWHVPQLPDRPRLNSQHNLAHVLAKRWAENVTFIWSHDDIFLTRPFTLDELTALSWCGRREQKFVAAFSRMEAATRDTLDLLEEKGLPTTNYELHLPLVIRPEDRDNWVNLMPRDDRIQFRTWVLNHLAWRRPKLIDDVKVYRGTEKLPALGIYSTAPDVGPRFLRPYRRG